MKGNTMKTTGKRMAVWAIAALALASTSSIRAGETGIGAQSNTGASYEDKSPALQPYVPAPNYYRNRQATELPARSNRASGIIGMDVRNQENERLGTVKDVVFDLNSERVSYVVIATAHTGFLGTHEKLVAVPLNALATSPNDRHLILNADQAKMEAAAGFDRNNWPDVNSPSWGAEPFWQSNSAAPDKSMPPTPEQKP
jgi:sporulation protein YlmC with PRC-barrel domain